MCLFILLACGCLVLASTPKSEGKVRSSLPTDEGPDGISKSSKVAFTSSSASTVARGDNVTWHLKWRGLEHDAGISITWKPKHSIIMPQDEINLKVWNYDQEPGTGEVHLYAIAHQVGRAFVYYRCKHGCKNQQQLAEQINSTWTAVNVIRSFSVRTASRAFGWIYFAAWSLVFYPQIYENWQAKSVIGLSFDFLLFDIVGFIAYCIFNVVFFWSSSVKHSFFLRHRQAREPVQLNDVAFSIHALLATLLTLYQCIIYKRGKQSLSNTGLGMVSSMSIMLIVMLIVVLAGGWSWLGYIYAFSYVKLGCSIIKYAPQVWLNYSRQNTEGWSIGTVLLDFAGAIFCMLQMFLLGYNFDDWHSIFYNSGKFFLAAITLIFNFIFIIQHFVLYREYRGYVSIPSVNNVSV